MDSIEFQKVGKKLLLVFTIMTDSPNDWVREELKKNGTVTFKRTFTFNSAHQQKIGVPKYEYYDHPPVGFLFGIKEGDYFRLDRSVLGTNNSFYIHQDITLKQKHFVASSKISVLALVDKLVHEDIYIGGNRDSNMPFEAYTRMLANFPTTHERDLYAYARVSSTVKSYFDSTKDAELRFQAYRNKKVSAKGMSLIGVFREYELEKYEAIYEKLTSMLATENVYSENQWQDEILEIILLLYPKYVFATTTVHLKIDNKKRRFLDFMLVDSNGHVDVAEIKKPFHKSIMATSEYRGNYPPHKDLIGTIMQLEKYLFHLSRYGSVGEQTLTKKYRIELPAGMNIGIVNPKGLVIMGRDDNLSKEQRADFEIVKRKYKNVIDIVTYDDLLRRLQVTIEFIRKK
jgi:hypothetical protein